MTPLGNPVVPDVYIKNARSSGSTAPARDANACSLTATPRSSRPFHATVAGRGSSPSTTIFCSLGSRLGPATGTSSRTMPR